MKSSAQFLENNTQLDCFLRFKMAKMDKAMDESIKR